MPVTTRTANSDTHPGNPVIAGQRKRRTKAEIQAAKEAEVSAQAMKMNDEHTRKAVLERLEYLETQAASAAKAKLAAIAMPPTPSSLVVKGAGSSRVKGTNAGRAANMKGSNSKSKEGDLQEAKNGSVSKVAKTSDQLTRRNVEIIRTALETPTPKGRSGKKAELLIVGNKKAKASAQASGFRDGYTGNSRKGAVNAKAGTIQVKKPAAPESDPIEEDDGDIEMLQDEDFDNEVSEAAGEMEEGGKTEVEVIDVDAFPSSSDDGDSIPFGNDAFGDGAEDRLTKPFEREAVSVEVGMSDHGRIYGPPWGRNPAPKEKWNKFDLPIAPKDHGKFSEEFIHRFIEWVGNQRVTFNTNSLNILMAMQRSWDVVFLPAYPQKIARHTAVHDITMQKTYQWRNTLGSLAYDCVENYFQERKDLFKTDDERAAHVDELLKMGGKLPFLYARIRTNEENGKREGVGAFQGPIVLKVFAAHLKAIEVIEKRPVSNSIKPYGALALAATAVERAFTASAGGYVNRVHSWFSDRNWGDVSLKYLAATQTLSDATWSIIVRRAKATMDKAGPDQFKILKDLPDQPVNDYAVDDIVDEEWLAANQLEEGDGAGNGGSANEGGEVGMEDMKVEEDI
ncbi:hypothetical protein PHLCEN_2v8116 [Hermanssonia centrifuga]|uniref:DUF6532 domain-containing protein n=1 Tax=Hermanssonia centrifuga TaxID=98765 RepID=A0A2R6NUM5_9APHY|nr:hypothetical protein PHLCEN_2v8116 [Hermanssonia centrifuga]